MQLRNLFLPLLTFVALLVQWNSIEASVDPSDYLNRTRFRRVWRDCRNVLSDDSVKAALTSRQVLESNVIKESSRSITAFTKKLEPLIGQQIDTAAFAPTIAAESQLQQDAGQRLLD